MSSNNFTFVVFDGPEISKDPAVRTSIRKQAMRDVGFSRRRNANQKPLAVPSQAVQRHSWQATDRASGISPKPFVPNNRRQTERSSSPSRSASRSNSSPFVSTSSNCTSPDGADAEDDLEAVCSDAAAPKEAAFEDTRLQPIPILSGCITCSGYQRTRMKFGVDINDLAILTDFNVNKASANIIIGEPSHLKDLLGHKASSYLEYIPSRYGSSECVTTATDCLLAKTQSLLLPQKRISSSLDVCNRLYGQALRSLQQALQDQTVCEDPNVLCAAQLLSLHELLDTERDAAWSQHVRGSARLIQYRTPQGFQSDFEKALFASHVGPILAEAMLNNQPCYLAAPEWIRVYQSTIQNWLIAELTDRAPLAINLRIIMTQIPGLWHDIHEAVNSAALFDANVLAGLQQRCRKCREDLLRWMGNYKSHCTEIGPAKDSSSEQELRRQLLGTAVENHSIINRLLATVCDSHRQMLEIETQALASLSLELQKQPSSKYSSLFTNHEIGVMFAAMETRDDWEEDVSDQDIRAQKIAVRARYNRWNSLLRGV